LTIGRAVILYGGELSIEVLAADDWVTVDISMLLMVAAIEEVELAARAKVAT